MRYFMCDFETTVYDNQNETEVWASALVEFNTDLVYVWNNIQSFFDFMERLKEKTTIYFHNVKFDGSFIIHELFKQNYKLAFEETIDENGKSTWFEIPVKKMKKHSFQTLISDRGVWYSITIRNRYGVIITILDSYKLLPFSVEQLAKDFDLPISKLSIEYKGDMRANGKLTNEQISYIKNDVLIPKKVLEIMKNDGHKKMTIGSCCFHEYKKGVCKRDWEEWFPNLKNIELDPEIYGSSNVDEYCRKAYLGGWVYCDTRYSGRVIENGITIDNNSLYPAHSLTVGEYKNNPSIIVGEPRMYKNHDDIVREIQWLYSGNIKRLDHHFIVRFKCAFEIKKDHLPFIHIRNSWMYPREENLTTSKIYNPDTNLYEDYWINDNVKEKIRPELTLHHLDFFRFFEHYNVYDIELLDIAVFHGDRNVLDKYFTEWKNVKENSKGAKRTIAKLFSNNLIGKFGTSCNASFKIPYIDDDGILRFHSQPKFDKQPIYIPLAVGVLSASRDHTIRMAQKNYKYFCYSDTDSLHLCCDISKVKGVELHPTKYGAWKCEMQWKKAVFVRQKTYMELGKNEKGNEDFTIKCAGMPKRCKDLFQYSVEWDSYTDEKRNEILEKYSEYEGYITQKHTLDDFKIGMEIPGKLKQTQIKGGVVLKEEPFVMRAKPNSFYN